MDENEHPDDQDFPDPTNDEIYESFIQTMGIDLDEEAQLHTPSFRTNNTIAVDLVQEQPEQPDEGQNDDLVNHDMQEAKEEPVHPFPGKPDRSTRPINPHAQRLVLASKQPVEYQKPKGSPKSKAKAKAKAKAKTTPKKPKAKAKARTRQDGSVTPYTAAFESFKEQPPSRT
ncbi:unnamed protein product [Symbiodinium sp. CCMP2592]|nr:unnamed protein product [Symbiodinium sp. CCMP2592]